MHCIWRTLDANHWNYYLVLRLWDTGGVWGDWGGEHMLLGASWNSAVVLHQWGWIWPKKSTISCYALAAVGFQKGLPDIWIRRVCISVLGNQTGMILLVSSCGKQTLIFILMLCMGHSLPRLSITEYLCINSVKEVCAFYLLSAVCCSMPLYQPDHHPCYLAAPLCICQLFHCCDQDSPSLLSVTCSTHSMFTKLLWQ